jgi:hypothetical protein
MSVPEEDDEDDTTDALVPIDDSDEVLMPEPERRGGWGMAAREGDDLELDLPGAEPAETRWHAVATPPPRAMSWLPSVDRADEDREGRSEDGEEATQPDRPEAAGTTWHAVPLAASRPAAPRAAPQPAPSAASAPRAPVSPRPAGVGVPLVRPSSAVVTQPPRPSGPPVRAEAAAPTGAATERALLGAAAVVGVLVLVAVGLVWWDRAPPTAPKVERVAPIDAPMDVRPAAAPEPPKAAPSPPPSPPASPPPPSGPAHRLEVDVIGAAERPASPPPVAPPPAEPAPAGPDRARRKK